LDAAPRRDEKFLVGRLKRDVTARLVPPHVNASKRRGAFAAAALAAVGMTSVAVAATLVIVRHSPAPHAQSSGGAQPVAPAEHDRASAASEKLREPENATLPGVERGEPSSEQAVENVPERAHSAPAPVVEPATPSELFSRANQARRDGKVTEAVRLYRALQERFSGSSEELVSRVALGRLLLDRLGDSRGALVQFNSYLASPGHGALREEAMVGRALSLGRMGRAAEERAAWRDLLDAWPQSTYRKRAQARLAELSGAEPAAHGAVRGDASHGASGGGRAE
jgi:TolA-binding protein